jgi:hypothetical protein
LQQAEWARFGCVSTCLATKYTNTKLMLSIHRVVFSDDLRLSLATICSGSASEQRDGESAGDSSDHKKQE